MGTQLNSLLRTTRVVRVELLFSIILLNSELFLVGSNEEMEEMEEMEHSLETVCICDLPHLILNGKVKDTIRLSLYYYLQHLLCLLILRSL